MDTEKKTEENEEMHFTNENKRGLAGQMRSQINKLTSNERWMLKAMLGYALTDPSLGTEHQTIKSPSSARIYIFESLWPGPTRRGEPLEYKKRQSNNPNSVCSRECNH